jgi:hypothetical protein
LWQPTFVNQRNWTRRERKHLRELLFRGKLTNLLNKMLALDALDMLAVQAEADRIEDDASAERAVINQLVGSLEETHKRIESRLQAETGVPPTKADVMRLLRAEFFKAHGLVTEHDKRRIGREKKKLASAKVVLKAKEDAMEGRHRSSLRALSWDTKKTYVKDTVRPPPLAPYAPHTRLAPVSPT